MSEGPSMDRSLPLAVWRRIDELCDRFEAEWKAGRRPSLEGYLETLEGAGRSDLFRELLLVEVEHRRGRGEQPRAEEYRPRFREHAPLLEAVLGEGSAPGAGPPPEGPFPALQDLETQTIYPLGASPVFAVGRRREADLPVLDPGCSKQQFQIVREADDRFLESLSTTSPTLCDDRPVVGRVCLRHGMVVQAGGARFRYLAPGSPGAVSRAPSLPREVTIPAGGCTVDDVLTVRGNISLPAGALVLGRGPGHANVLLPHPTVSGRHARLTVRDGQTAVADLGSANGTFVNGKRLRAAKVLALGDRLGIGPYAFRFTGQALAPESRAGAVELVARGLTRAVPGAGGRLLLDGVDLVVPPRRFLCILGPSGCGKSTLLAALSARAPADRGRVLLNRLDLYACYDELKRDLVVVPQQDVLHETLTVEEALRYTARLRLPPDTSLAERELRVEELLATVGLTERRGLQARQLSGGQRKRVSLALELVSKPTLLFLDEVTSGLDEQTDRDMMALFRSLADTGKTVVGITHSLANVEASCHLVAVLAPGGKLAFVGAPAESLTYFGIARLGDVYNELARWPAEEWQAKFRASPQHARHVAARLPPEDAEAPAVPRRAGRPLGDVLRQTALLSQREAAVLRGDRGALLALVGQCLLVAGLLVLVFGDLSARTGIEQGRHAATLLFLLAVCSLWFGCNNAAKAVAKEKALYARERAFNLRIASYLGSKGLVLSLLGALQAALLAGIVGVGCRPPGFGAAMALILVALAVAGTALGLLLSASARTEDVAVALIPIVLIPQIVLADVLLPLEGAGRALARGCVTAYWGNRALVGLLPAEVAESAGLGRSGPGPAAAVVLAHALAYALAGYAVLMWRDRRRS